MRSPAHYYATYLDPNRIERSPPRQCASGQQRTARSWSQDRFSAEYIALPEGLDRRTKEGKQAYADLLATGAELLTSDDMSLVMNMACAFRDNAISRACSTAIMSLSSPSLQRSTALPASVAPTS